MRIIINLVHLSTQWIYLFLTLYPQFPIYVNTDVFNVVYHFVHGCHSLFAVADKILSLHYLCVDSKIVLDLSCFFFVMNINLINLLQPQIFISKWFIFTLGQILIKNHLIFSTLIINFLILTNYQFHDLIIFLNSLKFF